MALVARRTGVRRGGVGDNAADTFNTAARACTTRDELLRLIRATVRTR